MKLVARIQKFLLHDIWVLVPGPGWSGSHIWTLRTLFLVIEGFLKEKLLVRAGALTYKVTFAIIPFFAVILALFQGFGGLQSTAEEVKKLLLKHLTPDIGSQLILTLDELIGRLNAAALGVVGFVVLLYSVLTLLTTVEESFNVIWGVRRPRALMRRLAVYWTLMTIGPICLAVSIAASGFVQNQAAYQWLLANVPVLNSVILALVPFVLTWAAFAAMYIIMPNTTVSTRAAIVGAVVAGTAWELLKRLYVLYNAKVVTAYEVYGSMGAIPVFLLWIYLSWILVLFGAEMAFAVQHVRTYQRELRVPQLSQAFKEELALCLMLEVARDFMAGRDPATGEQLARRLGVPVRAANDVAFTLSNGRLLREVVTGQATAYTPGEDLDRITVRRVLDVLRRSGEEAWDHGHEQNPASRLARSLREAEAAATQSLEQKTFRQLAGESQSPDPGAQTGDRTQE